MATVKARSQFLRRKLPELDGKLVGTRCPGSRAITLGTTDLYQGSAFSFSARYSPVGEWTSLARW